MACPRRFTLAVSMVGIAESYLTPQVEQTSRKNVQFDYRAVQTPALAPMQEGREAEIPASSWNPVALGMIVGLFAAFVGGTTPVHAAADLDNGSTVFSANCAA